MSSPPIALFTTPTDDRFGSTFASGDGFFFVWGGAHVLDGPETDLGDGATFDVATGAWTKLPDGGPSARMNAMIISTGCDVIVYGGAASGVVGTLQNGMMYRP